MSKSFFVRQLLLLACCFVCPALLTLLVVNYLGAWKSMVEDPKPLLLANVVPIVNSMEDIAPLVVVASLAVIVTVVVV
jgi:hypothetical protein